MTEDNDQKNALLDNVSTIVAAYVNNNSVDISDISTIINEVYNAFSRLNEGYEGSAITGDLKPAVPVKKSITDEHIICLEDGKKFKSLKRHLRTSYNMTPEQYREKWGLPSDYPMVAPNYAQARSRLAKEMGLGQQRGRAN